MSSAPLKSPIRELLDDSLDAEEMHDLWLRVATAPERRRLHLLSAAAVALSAAAALVVVLHLRPPAHGPLRLDDSADVPMSVAPSSARALALDDGSAVSVTAGTRLDLLQNDGATFSLALRTGHAEFEVRPGGPRTWRVESAGVTVEVVGTHFTVERTAERVTIHVARGAVLVRGDAVPDRVARVGAGQALTVPILAALAESAAPPEPGAAPAVEPTAPAAPTEAAPSGVVEVAPAPSSSPVPAAARSFARDDERPPSQVNATLPSPLAPPSDAPPTDSPVPPETAASSGRTTDADALFSAADDARRAGRPEDAVRLLTGLVASFPTDSHAPLAELTLGRLLLDHLNRPGEAGDHFTRALSLSLPRALSEEAAERAVEAYARAGDARNAATAAARYFDRFPNGARAERVRRWASGSR